MAFLPGEFAVGGCSQPGVLQWRRLPARIGFGLDPGREMLAEECLW